MLYKIGSLIFLLCLSNLAISQIQNNADLSSNSSATECTKLIEKGKVQDAEVCIRSFLSKLNTRKEKTQLCYVVARTYNNSSYYNISLNYAFEGIEYASIDSFFIKELYEVIINNHIDLKNYDLAESFYLKTSKIQSTRAKVKANEYNLIGEIHRLRGNFEKSLIYFHSAIQINETNSFHESLAINLNNLGLSHLYLKNLDSSQIYLDKSYRIIERLNLSNRNASIQTSYGELYFMKGEYNRALEFFKKTISYDLINHPDEYEVYRDAYKGMMKCYEAFEDFQNALNNHIKYQEYNTKILDYRKNAEILQNQILNDRKIHGNELLLVNNKLEFEKKFKTITYIIFGNFLIIIILIIYNLLNRNKRVKQKVELEKNKNKIQDLELKQVKLGKQQLESELIQSKQIEQIKILKQSKLEEQIESKNRELTSTAIHLMSKNELLGQIQEKLKLLGSNDPNDLVKVSKEINFLISDSLRLDKDWVVFKKHFTDVHPEFLESLKARFSELTTEDLKLCAYLKIQLSSKEIARLINVTIAAVNKRRNRLRKKMEMKSDEDFHDFFLKLKSF